MAFRRGNRHEFTIDGQTVWLDSLNEEIALRRFVDQYGFAGKWIRPRHGIRHAGKLYSPDFELAVDENGNTSRALVEVKQYRRDFTKDIARRMSAVAGHYNTNRLYLYTVIKDEWFMLDVRTSLLNPCGPPSAGSLDISRLMVPGRYVSYNWYGRKYYRSFSDVTLSVLWQLLTPAPRKTRRRKR